MCSAAFPELPINAMREQLLASLLHVGRSIPPPGFVQFWSRWRRPVFTGEASLSEIGADHPLADAARRFNLTHVLSSVDGVRLGVHLAVPDGVGMKGLVITTHGYAVGEDEPLLTHPAWLKRGLGVLSLRVRGYPGSSFDVGAWSLSARGWIARGIEDVGSWSLPAAVGDVIAAFRACRARFGEAMPIALHGESFGGALAILAASQLSGRGEVSRMVLGLPTMGDWNWRLQHARGGGLEADIRRMLVEEGDRAKEIRANLRLFDTVVHAKRVVCPVVMKIAANDPVVPPPTVGAIYNALGSAPGTKWRFLVRDGHTPDPAADDLRRHALFDRVAGQFLDPTWPIEEMTQWEPTLATEREAR